MPEAVIVATARSPIGRAFKGQYVVLLVDGLDVRVLNDAGELMRQFVLDPTRNYQPSGRPRYPNRAATMSTMS